MKKSDEQKIMNQLRKLHEKYPEYLFLCFKKDLTLEEFINHYRK